jgi:predicted lipoprotein with Yx(FWY)xxD motif
MRKSLLGAAPILAALTLAACGGGGGGAAAGGGYSSSSPSAAKPASSNTPNNTAIAVKHGQLGSYLADSQGHALYLFEADKGTMSTCYSACASVWPPLTAPSTAKAGTGVTSGLLGTTKRNNGTAEVTYHGHPLYLYAGDTSAGATNGQGLDQFGAKWYLVAPNGKKIDNDNH